MTMNQTTTQAQARRRPGIGTREWRVVSDTGDSRLEEVGKHQIMRRAGLPGRDLRALDPVLSYPSSILGRERAIVVNLEHIKAIITATEVLIVNSSNPLVVEFLVDLRHRISGASLQPSKEISDQYLQGDKGKATWSPMPFHPDLSTQTLSKKETLGTLHESRIDMKDGDNEETALHEPLGSSPKSLPFEFRALEACLESACRCLESEIQTLEQEAYPALDELTSQISTLNLERVRQIKSRLVAISGRVQKVRDEVEHLLDDDNDMAEMYLTEKLKQSTGSLREDLDNDSVELDDDREDEDYSKYRRYSDEFTYFKPNIEELEMLLEAYFAQIDGMSQKLSTMNEYVDDTEDYINIMLDDKQNQLLQMGVLLSTANMIINAAIVVVGIFGMNIHISLYDGEPRQFMEATLGTTGGCLVLFLLALGWGKKRYQLSF